MLSRVADSIYWMARYVERAENLARFIDVTLNLILDQPGENAPQWEPLIFASGDQKFFQEHYREATAENVIRFLTFDRKYPNSIASALAAARENARCVRETISSETWEQLNEFYHFVRQATRSNEPLETPSEFFRTIKQHSHLFNGIMDATMSHGTGWHFANIGRLLERADKTSRILDVKYFTLLRNVQDVGTPVDDLQWSSVLRSVSGFEMFRKQFHGITVHRVVDFLILDREFPRAIKFCVAKVNESLHEISGAPMHKLRNRAEELVDQLQSELVFAKSEEIVQNGLHEFVDSLQNRLNVVGGTIRDTFFSPVEPP